MDERDIDVRLMALLAQPAPASDPRFADRVVALARHDLAARRARRRAIGQVAIEALALGAVAAAFAFLAGTAPQAAGLGDSLGLANPATLGLAMLAMWAIVGIRPAAAGR